MPLQNISQFFPNSFLTDCEFSKSLGEEFILCENRNMVFHWADFYETCDVVKQQMELNPALAKDFKAREANLERLSMIPVWIRTEKKVHQTTIHELYERYILNHGHSMGGLDAFCPIEISFISGSGPFKAMSVAECFNSSTYKDFILVYLINGKLPKRDFRIRVKSKILMEFGKEYKEAHLVALEQMTMNGLLLSMESEVFLKKVSKNKSMRLLINAETLKGAFGLELPELKIHLSNYAFNLLYSSKKEDAIGCELSEVLVQSSFDFSKNKKVFLFVGYDKLSDGSNMSVKYIQEFVTHTKELVSGHYQGPIKSKSA